MSNLAISGGQAVRSEPWPAWPQHGPDVREAIARVGASGMYHPMFGKETEAFEKAFAEYHGSAVAVAVAHGTTALQAAIAGAGIGCGDEVIVPAYTYAASAGAVVEQNAIPIFADSEPDSQGLDPEDVRRKLTPATKAIMVVHTNGYPCDMDAIMALAEKHNLIVIEDCSHAHGARYKGRLVGTIGHFGAFSLQHKKNLSAGTGGVTITNDEAAGEQMRKIRNYEWHDIGHNWQISEFSSAIAAVELSHLDEKNAIRRANAATLLDALGDVPGITPLPGLPETEPVYYNVILQYDAEIVGAPRQAFVKTMAAEGIPIKMFYQPLPRWPIFDKQNFYNKGCPFTCPLHEGNAPEYKANSMPVAEAICGTVNLEIKVQPPCGKTEMQQIADAIHKIIENKADLAKVEL